MTVKKTPAQLWVKKAEQINEIRREMAIETKRAEVIALLEKQAATFKGYGLVALARQVETKVRRIKRRCAKADAKVAK